MALTVVVNGQKRRFDSLDPGAVLAELVAALGLQGDRVAIEVAGGIVSRTQWAVRALEEGVKVEVVHFVGGGCAR